MIEVSVWGKCACIAVFYLYCTNARAEKMEFAGYCCHLQVNDFRFAVKVKITIWTIVIKCPWLTIFVRIDPDPGAASALGRRMPGWCNGPGFQWPYRHLKIYSCLKRRGSCNSAILRAYRSFPGWSFLLLWAFWTPSTGRWIPVFSSPGERQGGACPCCRRNNRPSRRCGSGDWSRGNRRRSEWQWWCRDLRFAGCYGKYGACLVCHHPGIGACGDSAHVLIQADWFGTIDLGIGTNLSAIRDSLNKKSANRVSLIFIPEEAHSQVVFPRSIALHTSPSFPLVPPYQQHLGATHLVLLLGLMVTRQTPLFMPAETSAIS